MHHPPISQSDLKKIIENNLPPLLKSGCRILAIIPDRTRSAPIPVIFPILNYLSTAAGCHLDYLIALGTQPPLDHQEIEMLVGTPPEQLNNEYPDMQIMNHWAC